MKLCRAKADGAVFYGVIEGEQVKRLSQPPFEGLIYDGRRYSLDQVKLLAPVEPSKVVCVGKNYVAHAVHDMHQEVKDQPLLFLKPATCVIGPEERILYPEIAQRVEFEAELGVVIGKRCKNVKAADFQQVVLGYTCLNDVTERDMQYGDEQWTRGKTFDTFCPIGPWVETELDPTCIKVESYLNGKQMQCGTTADMVFSIGQILEHINQVMTLEPGDVIATGTPVGVARMVHGDVIEIVVEGIGTLRNQID